MELVIPPVLETELVIPLVMETELVIPLVMETELVIPLVMESELVIPLVMESETEMLPVMAQVQVLGLEFRSTRKIRGNLRDLSDPSRRFRKLHLLEGAWFFLQEFLAYGKFLPIHRDRRFRRQNSY
jgi:hypothetical protein